MPRVGEQQFPYTQKGMRDAEQYSRLTGMPVEYEQGQQPGFGKQGPQGGYGGGMNRPPQIGSPNPMAMRGRGIGPGPGGIPQRGNPMPGLRNAVGGGMPRGPMQGRGNPLAVLAGRGAPPRGMPPGRMPQRGGPQYGGPRGGGNQIGDLRKILGKMAFDQNARNYGRLTDGKDIV